MSVPRWRSVSSEYDGHEVFQCLNCYNQFNSTGSLEGWKFCPFCGLEWSGQHFCRQAGSPRWYPVTITHYDFGTRIECWPQEWPRAPRPHAELVIQINQHPEPKWEDVRVFELGYGFGTSFAVLLELKRLRAEKSYYEPLPWLCAAQYRVISRPYQGRTYYPVNRDYCHEQLVKMGIVKKGIL